MDKKLLSLIRAKRQIAYDNPKSILKEFDAFLLSNGIYPSLNNDLLMKHIKNRKELIDNTLILYSKATLDNERSFLLDCLLQMGYDKNLLVKMVLDIFRYEKDNLCLWGYADFLYSIKDYSYLDDYIRLIMDASYGDSREMLILLVGESRKSSVLPYLIELSKDNSVLGHVLEALSYFDDSRIVPIMKNNVNNNKKWIADIAKKYLNASV